MPHCEEVPIPVFSSLPKLVSNDDLFAETEEVNSNDRYYSDSMSDTTAEWQSKVKPFSQSQLNDLVRDLALSKEASEVLASCLSEHGILDSKTKITFYCHRDFCFICFICHIYPSFMRKRIVSLYFGWEVRTCLGVAFF